MRILAAIGATPRALPVIVVLLAASAGILSSTSLADRAVRTLASQSLESTARGISVAAEQVLRAEEGRVVQFERLFSDRIVAYALIASADGTILFHTNPDLRGALFDDREAFSRLADGAAASRRTLLGTGRPVLLYDRLLQQQEGPPALLRLALHTVETDRMTARVGRLWWSVGAVLALLWTGGLLVVVLAARAEKHRREAERGESLALIGQMTSTLAHEIRNAIGSVKGYAQLAAERTEAGDPRAQQLATVLRGVARIEQLVGDLLLFSREERFTIADVDPAPLLAAIAASVEPWQGRVELDLEAGLRVRADAEKLERVVTNGVRNAVQAMGAVGPAPRRAPAAGRPGRDPDRGHGRRHRPGGASQAVHALLHYEGDRHGAGPGIREKGGRRHGRDRRTEKPGRRGGGDFHRAAPPGRGLRWAARFSSSKTTP